PGAVNTGMGRRGKNKFGDVGDDGRFDGRGDGGARGVTIVGDARAQLTVFVVAPAVECIVVAERTTVGDMDRHRPLVRKAQVRSGGHPAIYPGLTHVAPAP